MPVVTREQFEKGELQQLERLNVIELVDEPAEWTFGLTVVKKPDGS